MSSNTRKKNTGLNSAVLFAAWLAVVVAASNGDIETNTQVVPIAYQAE